MTVKSFFLTMGAGVAVGALGAMMLPKNSDAYRMTKQSPAPTKCKAMKENFPAKRCRPANLVCIFYF